MHSQCPTCRTVFAVSEAQLDAHHGLVRCGKCRDIFNASWNLVDGAPSKTTEKPTLESSPVVDSSDLPPIPRETDARKAMLELLGDLDPETEAQLLADAQRDDEEEEPLPPVTGFTDDHELQLEIDDRVRRQPPTRSLNDDEEEDETAVVRSSDTLQLELPAGFSDYDESRGHSAAQEVQQEEAPDFNFVTEPSTENIAARHPIEIPEPPAETVNTADEEIVIEAPPSLWGAFEDEVPKSASGTTKNKYDFPDLEELEDPSEPSQQGTATQFRRAALKSGEPRRAPVRVASGDSTSELSRPSNIIADDVRLVEIPQPRRSNMVYWIVGGVVLLLLVLWQVKVFFFDDLAQSTVTRPVLNAVCTVMRCDVPPRRASALIQLAATQVQRHPEVPGALQVIVDLTNRAKFTQAAPPVEVVLTDKVGDIVGRRTYSATEYRVAAPATLDPNQTKQVIIDLAQPAVSAVGYEVHLVSR